MRTTAGVATLLAALAFGLAGCDGKSGSAVAGGEAQNSVGAPTEARLFGFWQARLKHEGETYQVTWQLNPGGSLVQWIAEVKKDDTAAPAFSKMTGTWSLSGAKLRMEVQTGDGKSDTDDFDVSDLSETKVKLKSSDGAMHLVRTSTEPSYQAKAPKAEPEAQPQKIATASEYVPNGESRYLYFTLRAPMQVSLSANIDGGPISFMYQGGHFTESDYMNMLQNYMMSGLGAAVGSASGSTEAKDLQTRANRIERKLKGGVLTKIDAFGTYKGEWKTLPAGEHTIVLDNSGEIGTRRGDAAVELAVYAIR